MKWQADEAGFWYDLDLASRSPEDRGDGIEGYILLQELLDNGNAESHDRGVLLPHEDAAALSPEELISLGLPGRYPFHLYLELNGIVDDDDARFLLRFEEEEAGRRLRAATLGALLSANERSYVLGSSEYALLCAVSEFNERSPSERNRHDNWLRFAEVKKRAHEAGARLHPHLVAENAVLPDRINLDIDRDGEEMVIRPRVRGMDEFSEKFERFSRVRPKYSVTDNEGNRSRVVLDETQQRALEGAKELQRISGKRLSTIVDAPAEHLDPDVFDLDDFSTRVVELGFYQPKFFPCSSPYRSEWIPGFLVETSPEERLHVRFESRDEVQAFLASITKAAMNGEESILWEEHRIPIESAQRIAAHASKQFEDPARPSREGSQGLVVADNIEELSHIETDRAPTADEFRHLFQPVPDYRAGISPRDYQKEGIAWIQSLFDENPGGLLADDMGLGKTFQVLSAIKWHAKRPTYDGKPFLIVAPVSLLENWAAEYDKFFEEGMPELTFVYGETLRQMAASGTKALARRLREPELFLTNYATLRRKQLAFASVDWAIIVLDEAQKIKNPSTLITGAAKALKADFRIAVTGTPVENTLVDLWSIMDFVSPGLLGSAREFSDAYVKPIQDAVVDLHQLGRRLREKLGVFLKRRLKKDVLSDLPRKHVVPRPCHMPPKQRERYVGLINARRNLEGSAILSVIHDMRSASDHPYLLDGDLSGYTLAELIESSAKLQETVQILSDVQDRDEKAIVFVDRKNTQRMLARVMREAFDLSPHIINGDTPASAQRQRSAKLSRQQAIEDFERQDGFNLIVMSPLAAGVGLNVTAANHVIHYARHWNPAKEDQATDRAYRIGQQKDVHVYYPMATAPDFDTFDVVLDRLLQRKRELAEASLFPSREARVEAAEMYGALFGE